MPWKNGAAFASKHNNKLHGHAATVAAKQATAMVKAGVPEGEAIATANKGWPFRSPRNTRDLRTVAFSTITREVRRRSDAVAVDDRYRQQERANGQTLDAQG